MTADIIAGPAIITWGGQSLYSQGDIVVKKVQASWNPNSAMWGTIGKRSSGHHFEISFTPVGVLSSAQLAVLYPYTAASVGSSIYTAANVPLVIWTAAGKKYTFTRAGLAKPPSIRLSANSTALGEVTFYAAIGLGKAYADADAFVAISAAAFTDVTFATTNIVSPGYLGTWNTYASFETESGFTIDVALALSPLSVDRLGVFTHKITGFEVAVRFKPLDQTEANYLLFADLNGAAVKPGQAFGVGSYDLTIAGTGVSCLVPACGPGEAGLAFGGAVAQPGEITLHSTQEFAVGVPSALITWTIS
jgi:hypothetical protein